MIKGRFKLYFQVFGFIIVLVFLIGFPIMIWGKSESVILSDVLSYYATIFGGIFTALLAYIGVNKSLKFQSKHFEEQLEIEKRKDLQTKSMQYKPILTDCYGDNKEHYLSHRANFPVSNLDYIDFFMPYNIYISHSLINKGRGEAIDVRVIKAEIKPNKEFDLEWLLLTNDNNLDIERVKNSYNLGEVIKNEVINFSLFLPNKLHVIKEKFNKKNTILPVKVEIEYFDIFKEKRYVIILEVLLEAIFKLNTLDNEIEKGSIISVEDYYHHTKWIDTRRLEL